MWRQYAFVSMMIVALCCSGSASAEQFKLVVGVDGAPAEGQSGFYPGIDRPVPPVPGPGFPGTFGDGDRLAGTSDTGVQVIYQGMGTPMFQPNELGSLSLMFKRGSIPIGGGMVVPFMGIDFMGGPLLDLDGDLENDTRSLVPITGESAVMIPDTTSFIDLTLDVDAGSVVLNNIDATANNEGGPSVPPGVATVLVTIAGTEPDGTLTEAINPSIDTRVGSLNAYAGLSGTLTSVYSIDDLGFEFWQDTILASSSTANMLGTLQYMGKMRGWLVERDAGTGSFPMLGGEGLGSTLWPMVDASQVGNTFNTANGMAGGLATIDPGIAADNYTQPGNGGLPLTDFGGDLGAYFDLVVVPALDPQAQRFVYLEAAGFGINNSNDPVYTDTVAYDVVLIAQACGSSSPDFNGDDQVDASDLAVLLGSWGPCDAVCCQADLNGDGLIDAADLAVLLGSWGEL